MNFPTKVDVPKTNETIISDTCIFGGMWLGVDLRTGTRKISIKRDWIKFKNMLPF